MSIVPGAEPFTASGGSTAVLISHGFTGSPISMRPWGEYLAAEGYTVSVPLLPGHGTTWQTMNKTTWADWYTALETELLRLAQTHEQVFVCGLSMGGALALRLAERHPDKVAGLVLVNPAVKVEDPRLTVLPVLKHLIGGLPGIGNDIKKPGVEEGAYPKVPLKALASQLGGWAEVIADLAKVTQPLRLLRSREDHVVPATSSALILAGVKSADVTEVILENSYHVATIDNDAELIFARSDEFIRSHGG